MKFIPILFSTPMVQAINEGRKTMTRRVLKPQPSEKVEWDRFGYSCFTPERHIEGRGKFSEGSGIKFFKCPYGKPGDVLWVRETFSEDADKSGKYFYKADYPTAPKWKPNIFMPKAACRIFLEITNIRVERLQDITEQDAIAEGVEDMFFGKDIAGNAFRNYMDKLGGWDCVADDAVHSFKTLWQSINGPESWEANPWVWVIEFKRIEKLENFN